MRHVFREDVEDSTRCSFRANNRYKLASWYRAISVWVFLTASGLNELARVSSPK